MNHIYNYRNRGFSGNKLEFEDKSGKIGELKTFGSWKLKANVIINEKHWKLEESSIWNSSFDIFYSNDKIGHFKKNNIKLVDGSRFILKKSFWNDRMSWIDENGKTCLYFEQTGWSGKGKIFVSPELDSYTTTALISAASFHRKLQKQKSSYVAIFIPIIAAIAR